MKPTDWNKIPGGPPLPELANDPKAIEFWVSEVIQHADQVETMLRKTPNLESTRRCQWTIRDSILRASLRLEVELVRILFPT